MRRDESDNIDGQQYAAAGIVEDVIERVLKMAYVVTRRYNMEGIDCGTLRRYGTMRCARVARCHTLPRYDSQRHREDTCQSGTISALPPIAAVDIRITARGVIARGCGEVMVSGCDRRTQVSAMLSRDGTSWRRLCRPYDVYKMTDNIRG